jgi:transcriptional regulator with XRE-family HTH domain
MSEQKSPGSTPFKLLGRHLKQVREYRKESVAEVSGAVEIDIDRLKKIELGSELPSEEILLLLINHFGMPEREALQLWELAGYSNYESDGFSTSDDKPLLDKQPIVLLAMDLRTVYTDGLDISINQAGVTLNFLQSTTQAQPMFVARVGMSLEQANCTLQILQQALIKAKYSTARKALPPPTESK